MLDTEQARDGRRRSRSSPHRSEYKILELLCRHPGRVFSTEEIYRQVWNDDIVSDNAIAVHVRHIREKIEINPKEPRYLKVVWGVGYKIERSE